jgi:RNA polymerase sigma factor (sigma-70 family)
MTAMDTSDQDLVRSSLSGGPEAEQAFNRLVARHRPAVFGLMYAATGEPGEAEDLTQETLIAAYLGLKHLNDPSRFGAWLKGIARNMIRMWYRKRANAPALDGGHALEQLTQPAPTTPEEHLDRRERMERIHQAVQELSTGNQQAVALRYWAGMTYAQISAELNVPLSTVKSRLHKAKKQLQTHLGEAQRPRRVDMISVSVGELYGFTSDRGPEVIVTLVSEDGRLLPIWIGPMEGQFLAVHKVFGRQGLKRPLTYEMFADMLDQFGAQVERVVISALKDTTFYATIDVTLGQTSYQVDARPSDAINLALRLDTPVYVAEEVLDTTGIAALDELPKDARPIELNKWIDRLPSQLFEEEEN